MTGVQTCALPIYQGLFRAMAVLFMYPRPEAAAKVFVAEAWLRSPTSEPQPAVEGIEKLLSAWKISLEDLPDLQAEWVRLFGASRDCFCYPNAGAYGEAESAGLLIANLQRAYRRAGLVEIGRASCRE